MLFIFLSFEGRKGLAERSSLIRHPSSKQNREDILRMQQQQLNDLAKATPGISMENHAFIKDVSTSQF